MELKNLTLFSLFKMCSHCASTFLIFSQNDSRWANCSEDSVTESLQINTKTVIQTNLIQTCSKPVFVHPVLGVHERAWNAERKQLSGGVAKEKASTERLFPEASGDR